ncbi:class 1 fructose-bisphosphatase [Methanorbis furvi]|uniref:Fructose-1,6-bisphosphatase class 1 n=1 Tax=Methanorbis furvi TaxID=3028299 RepID=A0AAE4SAG5_9EURY|nr:Fructose-1,6-bisphosphatase class 1 [Methanocorpusculaceae archaeon Ag1]
MTTLQEYLKNSGVYEDLSKIIILIAEQAVPIRAAFISNQSYAGSTNASGEQQAAMDTWSDTHITRMLARSGLVRAVASEEQNDITTFSSAAKYSVVMDPLDGSSLISVNLCVGTIVGIYDGDVLQAGKNLKAAFYMLYGPMTTLTLTVGRGVAIFALNTNGVYQLLEDNVKMPEGNLYGSGGLRTEWLAEHTKYIAEIEAAGGKNRYSGSFVADFHQVLKYGGVYAYPPTEKSPDGKLRLVFEANPIGFIASQAGGAVSNGVSSTLAIIPTKVHQRTPIYVGSRGMIEAIEKIHRA